MPVETTNIGIRPVSQPQRTGGTEQVRGRGQVGSATTGFSPQTNVSIRNAVSDMAGILARISTAESEAIESMPQDLKQVVENVLQQAFSMDETLSAGLGSTIESQRFSMDQLGTMARMLSQLGHMAENGQTVNISDDMQALLTNLKEVVSEESGSALEPVLMAKAAFEMLDDGSTAALAPEIQELAETLQPMGQTLSPMAGERSDALGLLRQLVQYLMPRPEAEAYTGEPYGGQMARPDASWSAYQDGYGDQSLAGQYSAQSLRAAGGRMTEAGQIVRRQLAQLAAQTARMSASTSGETATMVKSPVTGEWTLTAGQPASRGSAAGQMTGQPVVPAGTQGGQATAGEAQMAVGEAATTAPRGLAAQPGTMPQSAATAQPGASSAPATPTSQTGAAPTGPQTATGEPPAGSTARPESTAAQPGETDAAPGAAAGGAVQRQGANRQAVASQAAMMGQRPLPESPAPTVQPGPAESGSPAGRAGQPAAAQATAGAGTAATTAEATAAAGTGTSAAATETTTAAAARGQAEQPTLAELQQRMQTTDGPQRTAMRQAKAQLMSQTLENTPQTMHALRDAAQLLLRSSDLQLSPRETQLLQNLAHTSQTTMDGSDAQELQRLIRICQQSVPATVQQVAIQNNMPDLPRIWAFMQLCDMSAVRRMSSRQLRRAGRDISAFVSSMRGAMEGGNAVQPGQRALSFMVPLYMGETDKGPVSYPAYVHVYDEQKQNEATGAQEKETWFRVCMLTSNIGAVELTCRVYDEQNVDMRVFFSDPESAYEFRQVSDEIRENLSDTQLQLKDFKITTAG